MAVITTISSTTTSTSTTTTTETSEIANFPVNDEDLQRMLSDIKHSGSEKIYEEEPEEQIKEYIERETTISNYPRAYPIPGYKTAYNKFSENWPGQMGKRIVKEDGTYVHAFQLMIKIQQMMFEEGLLSL